MSPPKKSKIITLPIASLVEDMDLYPRHAVDPAHVQALVFALEGGGNLPPITADAKSKKITDGWHRKRAYVRFHGPDATVDVELVDYADEAAMKLDAVARNAAHGRPLDRIDKTRSVLMLQTSGFTSSQIALALQVPEKRIEKLSIRVADGPVSSGETIPGTKSIALKRSVAHLEGGKLTKAQAKAHATMPGTSFLLIARQLCLALSENMVNLEDEKLVEQLKALRELLGQKVAK